MRALTIRQPWAWAILAGHKTVENRSWLTNFRGRFLVHAGRMDDESSVESFVEIFRKQKIIIPDLATLPTRAIIGSVNLTNCLPAERVPGPWSFGPFCFVLRDPVSLDPISCSGRLFFWKYTGTLPQTHAKLFRQDQKVLFEP